MDSDSSPAASVADASAAERTTIIEMDNERRIRLILPFRQTFSETPMGRRTFGYTADLLGERRAHGLRRARFTGGTRHYAFLATKSL